MFSFSSPSLLQPSFSQLPPLLLPQLYSLSSKLHAQPNMASLLLPVGLEAASPPHVSAAFLAATFQAFQCCFEKCQRGQEKT